MQNEAEGTRHPLEHFARAMISVSDNTATDHLLAYLGRDVVEAFAHQTNPDPGLPFLSTAELFKLKLLDWPNLAERYQRADEKAGREMLLPEGEITKASVSVFHAIGWQTPRAIEQLEWFATPRELAALCGILHGSEKQQPELRKLWRVNPGVTFSARAWKSTAFKGGSEPGVMNLTFLLEREDDAWFVLALTWNNPAAALKEDRLTDIALGVANLLALEPPR